MKPRILFVDDHEDTRHMISYGLQSLGYEVVVTDRASEGLRLARGERFDLYLLDSKLREGSGAALCDAIRRFDAATPLIFFTGEHPALLEGALDCPAEGVLMKYFETFLTDDTLQVGASGVTRKAQIVKGIGASTCDVKGYAMDGFDVVMLDADAAVLTFSATQDATCGGAAEPSPVWASTVFVKRGGKWLAAFQQETPAQKPAQPQATTEKKP